MSFRFPSVLAISALAALSLACGVSAVAALAQSSSNPQSDSSSSAVTHLQEKAPSLVDPGGPTISLVPVEPVFLMSAALNACDYDEGLDESSPVRTKVREEINQALSRREDARAARDKLCVFIAQHRMTGGQRDIAQYISLALYLTAPPELELSAELTEMPPDSTQVAEIVPLLRQFAEAVDLHGIWLSVRHTYDEELAKVHDQIYQSIQATNLYLRMPFDSYNGRRFVVVMEPMLSPRIVNARIYGTDYVVVVSPTNGHIRIDDVRHTYLHYLIEPLLFSRANAIDREQPILKEIREAPLEFRYRTDTVALTVECLIKAVEARTMNTGISDYKIPAGTERSELPKYEHERQVVQQKQEAVRQSAVHHDMAQGFVLTQYFYEQMIQFERDPASLKDTMGQMVYSMDIDQQVHRARQIEFDKQADTDVLTRSNAPRKLEGLDLAESKLQAGDVNGAGTLAHQFLAKTSDSSLQSVADGARANFILARVAIATGHPGEAVNRFQKALADSKEPRLIAWSHIYLGRMLDLDCKREEAVSEYKAALENRDGQQDTRLAAERGVKAAYAVKGHSCEEDDAEESPKATPAKPGAGPAQNGPKPQ
ncbi:hypothetical protein DYQ86_12400 [Acidobacteria bacterium AB60]|nr:hypothetical protein DYQ86_12400 [Acidobacteria bacterium AB60]